MNNRISRGEVAKQFFIAIQLLLEWIEQGEDSIEKIDIHSFEEKPHEPSLLTATEVEKDFQISKSKAYRLIQLGEIQSVRIRLSVRVRNENLEEFVLAHTTKGGKSFILGNQE
jgi:excisionase family DNA binding protein